ncbi:MlaE family ABC transporter permease [Pseudonocardia endophytica]|uniref:Phospholipid/cholesterol/gamma-HCH transport system permease protein n=1 Tax=Pseudonocardia endophytica TaxID=401976 RepID=A0A4R1HE15_PSEEN|nr:ABC transporter permease [Pseudonocardia endophytica]TCK20304.1 phospholipid/cholesterol/gamma-HCH transport system permease protein [Pseudonocardia endophytica]
MAVTSSPLGARLRRSLQAPLDQLEELGDQLSLYIRSILWMPKTITRYGKEVARLLAEVSFGSGALIVILGTAGVMASLSLFVGSLVGLQGFRALDSLGVEALTGFITAYFNTRDIAPLVAASALTATLGAGFTAQLGAMRISEEIDALEVMAVPSVPYLVTTRVIAGIIAVIPIYTIGLLASFVASRLNVTLINGLPGGTYDHYFDLFLPVSDVLYSYLKVIIFAAVIILIHCHYGYRATGGPAGVGVAVGRAVRLSIVSTAILDFFLTLVIFGTDTSVRVAG